MAKQRIDLGRIKARVHLQAEAAINAYITEAKALADANTPEKSGELIKNNVVEPAKIEGGRIVARLVNSTPYALFVEYGLGRAFKYHKRGSVFFVGIGARMFTKARDAIAMRITADFKNRFK